MPSLSRGPPQSCTIFSCNPWIKIWPQACLFYAAALASWRGRATAGVPPTWVALPPPGRSSETQRPTTTVSRERPPEPATDSFQTQLRLTKSITRALNFHPVLNTNAQSECKQWERFSSSISCQYFAFGPSCLFRSCYKSPYFFIELMSKLIRRAVRSIYNRVEWNMKSTF